MLKLLRYATEFLCGTFTGLASTWAFAGLTSRRLVFGLLPGEPAGPIRSAWMFIQCFINHNSYQSNLCWTLLLGSVFLFAVLIITVCRPSKKFFPFLAGYLGVTLATLSFIICWNAGPEYGKYFGSVGCGQWVAFQHHLSPYFTLRDLYDCISLLDRFVQHMDVIVGFYIIPTPILYLLLNHKSSTDSNSVDFNDPIMRQIRVPVILFAAFALPFLSVSAMGGIGKPFPEFVYTRVKIFYATKDVAAGQQITDAAIEERVIPVVSKQFAEENFSSTSPVGKVTKYGLARGQIIGPLGDL